MGGFIIINDKIIDLVYVLETLIISQTKIMLTRLT